MLLRNLFCSALLLSLLAHSAAAVEYMSVSAEHAILYDAPSAQGKKLFLVNRYMPFEVVVSLDAWVKVRDRSGALYWIEKSALSFNHYVYAAQPMVELRASADYGAASLAHIRQQIALEVLQDAGNGWLKVRHQDGIIGYVKRNEVWGN